MVLQQAQTFVFDSLWLRALILLWLLRLQSLIFVYLRVADAVQYKFLCFIISCDLDSVLSLRVLIHKYIKDWEWIFSHKCVTGGKVLAK